MWRAVGCPLLAREPRGLPRVVALGCLVPRVRGVVCFLFVGGADVAPEELVSALKPNLAQTLLVAEGLFRLGGAYPFSALERVPGSWYSSGSGCVINNACSADDSGVLNGSPSSFSSSSSSKIVVLCLLRVGGRMSSSGSSSYS